MRPVLVKLPQPLTPEEAQAFQQALMEAALCRARQFMAGLRAYQANLFQREDRAATVVWEKGSTKLRLYDCAPELQATAPCLLVIPSLVNRFDILDLEPDYSFLRFFAQKGFRVFVIDWDEPREEERAFSLSDYLEARLIPIFDFVKDQAKGAKIPVIGYCMGGLMALSLAAARKDDFAGLALLATPWDFAQESSLGPLFAQMMEKMEPFFAAHGVLPVPVLQSLFVGHQPLEVLRKYVRFAEENPASFAARRFVLTEDWLNDGVPLSAPVAQECLCGWYGRNDTGRGVWQVSGRAIKPQELSCPTYVIIPQKDRVVRPESAQALAALLKDPVVVKPALGHIGLMASPTARGGVWEPLAQWLLALRS